MLVTIGTNDTLASPGAQLDYFQSVIDKMGQATVDQFARFFVIPQAGHGLNGVNYSVDGDGKAIPSAPIPTRSIGSVLLSIGSRARSRRANP